MSFLKQMPHWLLADIILLVLALFFKFAMRGHGYIAFALTYAAALVTLCSGALLFVISDTVLVFIVFGGKSSLRMTAVNLYTYFIAQTLLALSVYMLA